MNDFTLRKKYDMIIFNACLMPSLEASSVLYQDVDYLLTFEETTPAIQRLYCIYNCILKKSVHDTGRVCRNYDEYLFYGGYWYPFPENIHSG